MAVDYIRIPVQFSAKLECTVIQDGKAIWIVVEVCFRRNTINTIATKTLLVVNKIYGKLVTARHCCCVNSRPCFTLACCNGHRAFKQSQLASVDFIVARHYDFYIMPHFCKLNGKSTYHVGKATCLCKRYCFSCYH